MTGVIVQEAFLTSYPRSLTPAEFKVFILLFGRSVGLGEKTCTLSQNEISKASNLTLPAIIKAIKNLQMKGLLQITERYSATSPATYQVPGIRAVMMVILIIATVETTKG